MKLLLILAGVVLIGTNARAQILLTQATNNLYNTGLANGGATLAVGSLDPHYTLLAPNPEGNGTTTYVTPLAGGWVGDSTSPAAQWISFSGTTDSGANGTYDYQLTLTNIPVGATVTIGGQVAADDQVVIEANGVTKYTRGAPAYGSLQTITSFTFISTSTNVLDFLVNNSGGGPTGLQAVLTGSYVTAVPETRETAIIYLVGACLLIGAGRVRRRFFVDA